MEPEFTRDQVRAMLVMAYEIGFINSRHRSTNIRGLPPEQWQVLQEAIGQAHRALAATTPPLVLFAAAPVQ